MRRRFPDFSVQKGSFLYLAALLLFVPVRLLMAFAVAALFHELCHIAAVVGLGHPVQGIFLGVFGAKIRTEPLSAFHEMLCALAGPLGALLLLLFARWIPVIALFAFVQSLYNMIPLYPLDGGRALRSVFALMGLGEKAYGIWETVVGSAVLAAAVWSAISWKLGIFPILVALYLAFGRNNSCKEPEGRVQYRHIKMKRYCHDRNSAKDSPNGAEACPIHRR